MIVSGEPRRDGEPAEPQAGREDLAGRAGVDDPVGREALDGADRLPIEPELRVVIVLDHECVASRGPRHEGGPALGRQHGAGRVLVGSGHDHGVDVGVVERVHDKPGVIDGEADQLETRGADHRLRVVERGVLDADTLALRDRPVRHTRVPRPARSRW